MDTLLGAYKAYLAKHGRRILAISRILGQDVVSTSIESLYWYHDPATGYRMLDHAVAEIRRDSKALARLRAEGIELVEEDGKLYVRASLSVISRLLSELAKSPKSL